ncbi:MAG: dihydroorotate dehydrogenase electron transfer subunit [Clostridiales bacterium]|nr:dihydroorotate dehydrogenase electron transfer subunit [Clostridiales bacterium]
MKQVFYTVEENRKIAKNVYKLRLHGDTSAITAPGQFVNLKIEGCYLRRPLSVCDTEGEELTLLYKVVGRGTEILSKIPEGRELDTLTGLGNGFDLSVNTKRPLLVGGGVGVPPLYKLAKDLLAKGAKPTAVLGFNQAEEVFYREEFEALGVQVVLMTADGSAGRKGFVTDAIGDLSYDYFYTCGPEPMFRALEKVVKGPGEYSFEERMGCGFGACMGCSCKTKYGAKRICKEGPVLKREEIVW